MRAAGAYLLLTTLIVLATECTSQPVVAVPRVQYDNPVHGFGLTIPEDWQMSPNKKGLITISIDADIGPSILWRQPVLWCFRTRQAPREEAQALAKDLQMVCGVAPAVRQRANGVDWEVLINASFAGTPIMQHWVCKQQGGVNFCLGAFVRPEFAQAFQQDVQTALDTVRIIPLPGLNHFREPTENAYRISFPEGWRWEGKIYRDALTPAYFVWKVSSPDGLAGAFSSPPANFNIQTPYVPAGQAAQSLVLPLLAREVPGVRIEAVHDLTRASAYYRDALRAAGLGSTPLADRSVVDFAATVNGVPIRIRTTILTCQLDSSPLLGGRGNWTLTVSGAWAPVVRFDQLYPVGRGIITSLLVDEKFDKAMRKTAGDAVDLTGKLGEAVAARWVDYIRQ